MHTERPQPGGDIAPILREAFAASGPTLINVVTSAEVYGEQLTRLRG